MSVSDSHSPSSAALIAGDLSRPTILRAVIADLFRTYHCNQGSILLVEGIEAQVPVSRRYRTVRLLLGDGELCVQALLRPEMHRFVDTSQLYVGCYVQLNTFEIRLAPLRSNGDVIHARSDEPEEMVFLIVRDMAVVGWDIAYVQMARTTGQEHPESAAGANGRETVENSKAVVRRDAHRPEAATPPWRRPLPVETETQAPKEDGPSHMMEVSGQGVSEHSEALCDRSDVDNVLWTLNDLSKPLKLTQLKSVPNLPYKQNWVVNILAIIASLSAVEPATLPPYKQRTARLADPSTGKQVLLTVFLDADDFTPMVGSVVLLLGVKNHRFDGGSLKKYWDERPRERSKWWFENPNHVEWCNVDGLKKWWADKSS